MSAPLATWIDGVRQNAVPALDRGLQYGDGLFTSIACRNQVLRFRAAHSERLRIGCERLGVAFDAWQQLERELDAVAALAPPAAVVKIIITRGDSVARGYRTIGAERARRIITVWEAQLPTHADRHAGVCLQLGPMRFGENLHLAGIKHLNRLESVLAQRDWRDARVFESVHESSSGTLACGTMSNVFLLRDGQIVTPAIDRAGVSGIMRAMVLRECAKLQVPAATATLTLADVWRADGVFLTNARIGIMPVTTLVSADGAERALQAVPLTLQLARHLEQLDA